MRRREIALILGLFLGAALNAALMILIQRPLPLVPLFFSMLLTGSVALISTAWFLGRSPRQTTGKVGRLKRWLSKRRHRPRTPVG